MNRITSHLAAVASALLLIAIVTTVRADSEAVPGWSPDTWADLSTMQIMTTSPEGEEHWSTLWLVVIDHKLYARLGTRSYGRIQTNKTIPWVKLKIDDKQFDKVLVENAPEMKDKVATAMAQKYWLDMLVRYSEHPCTARLIAQPTAPAAAPPPAATSQ